MAPRCRWGHDRGVAISDDPAIAEFFNGWEVYRAIIDQDCMEHRQVYSLVEQVLGRRTVPFTVLDLGCGDAAGIAPVLRGLPLARYVGVDVAQQALGYAADMLQGLDADLRCRDLGDQLRDDSQQFDVILLSFALHHFDRDAKREVLSNARERLAPRGQVILIDVVRVDGESRDEYLARFDPYVATWPIGADMQARVLEHVRRNDWPEEVMTMAAIARAAGFTDVTQFYAGGSDTQAGWVLSV